MADFSKYYPILANHEGGYSADPKDKSAAAYPSSYVMTTGAYKGYRVHTNRGITFRTFVANAKKVGLQPTTQVFINLTYEQAKLFYKILFWDSHKLDLIRSQGVAELIAEAFVGSTLGGNQMVKDIQKYLKSMDIPVKYTGKLDAQTIAALNSVPANITSSKFEQGLINFMTGARLKFLQSLKVYPTYANTWNRRVVANKERALSYIA